MRPDRLQIDGLSEKSVLYVSATVHPSHPLHTTFRKYVDRAPDFDLGRMVESAGPWVRRYFADRVIDGTTEDLPRDLSGYSGLVVGCSLHFVNPRRTAVEPWQSRVMDLIRRAVFDHDMPFLGMCGGGQLGLAALGGRVGPNPVGVGLAPEQPGSLVVRTTNLELTEEGRQDPLFRDCPASFGMIAIHSDHLEECPEPEFRVLAHSADIPNQAVAFGDRVRLLAVHPEMSSGFVRQMSEVIVETGEFGPYPKDALYKAASRVVATPESNTYIIRNFLQEFCARYEAEGIA